MAVRDERPEQRPVHPQPARTAGPVTVVAAGTFSSSLKERRPARPKRLDAVKGHRARRVPSSGRPTRVRSPSARPPTAGPDGRPGNGRGGRSVHKFNPGAEAGSTRRPDAGHNREVQTRPRALPTRNPTSGRKAAHKKPALAIALVQQPQPRQSQELINLIELLRERHDKPREPTRRDHGRPFAELRI
jgi:hypothetical protein